MKNEKLRKACLVALVLALLVGAFCITAFAGPGDVAGALENTWSGAKGQIKKVVDNVVFPALDLILAVMFFVSWAVVILTTKSMVSSNLQARRSFLLAFYWSPRPHFISGRSSARNP